jgi:glycosyltransferase involved in cell wall biosynthesis|tara:strand:+ start:1393 stop:2520 length:1128 start_codon:yes stop_codon:yes gene_type:complete
MVKAVNVEDKTKLTGVGDMSNVSIENPEDDVEFKIDFDEKKQDLAPISKKAIGGTELMRNWLYDEVEEREPGLLNDFQIISTRVRELEEGKKRILWVHDLAGDPEVQHLKDKDSLKRFERVVFVSHWQQYQFNAYLGLPYDKGVVIQNAITPIPVHEKPKDGDKINVCYFSTPHRGLEVLLNAWDFMRDTLKEGHNAELNIYSSFKIYDRPHMDEQFRHIYKRAKETEGVNYYGTVDNNTIREMLPNMHIMAYPSIYEETSCITLIEACSAGCLAVVPSLGALPETGANFPWMYGYEQDPEKHAQVHGHILGRAIEHFWDEDIQNLLRIQKSYFDMFYNWSLRSGQWQQFLHAVRSPIEVQQIIDENKKKDGTTS